MSYDFQSPMGNLPPFEIPGAFREMAENGLQQIRQTYQQFKVTAESANGAIEASCTQAAKGAASYQSKLLEMARDNTHSAFEFYNKLLAVKSVGEMTEVLTSHAKEQTEALSAQSRTLAELGKKVAEDSLEPFKDLKDTATKAFQPAEAAFQTVENAFQSSVD